jgi:hypothetical protein
MPVPADLKPEDVQRRGVHRHSVVAEVPTHQPNASPPAAPRIQYP